MAKLTNIGSDELSNILTQISSGVEEYAEEILEEAAKIAVKKVKESTIKHGHVDSGEMFKNIGASKIKRNKDGKPYIQIMSFKKSGQGKQQRDNAYKALWLNYGTSHKGKKRIVGDRFWDKGIEAAEKELESKAEQIHEKFLKSKGEI